VLDQKTRGMHRANLLKEPTKPKGDHRCSRPARSLSAHGSVPPTPGTERSADYEMNRLGANNRRIEGFKSECVKTPEGTTNVTVVARISLADRRRT
jgi:hypothetical protein